MSETRACGAHDGPHEDEILGEWTDDELSTWYPEDPA